MLCVTGLVSYGPWWRDDPLRRLAAKMARHVDAGYVVFFFYMGFEHSIR